MPLLNRTSPFTGPEFTRLLTKLWPDHTLDSSTTGHGVALPIESSGELFGLIVYAQPAAFEPGKLQALRALTTLGAMASNIPDMTLDIAAQKISLDSLRAEVDEVEAFYREFSNAVRQCFWVLDLEERRALHVSENFEQLWGLPKSALSEDLTGFMKVVIPADRDRVLSDFHTHLGRELNIEFRIVAGEGEIRWIWLRGFPIGEQNESHEFHRIVLIADDVTERKAQEEVVREQEAILISRGRTEAIGDLASGVAHEINNPLTVLIGKAAEIKANLKKPEVDREKIADCAEKIQRTSMRISEIILSLKALARNEKGESMKPTPFSRILNEVRDVCTERFKNSGVQLEIADVPPNLIVEMNPTLVLQMLVNLLNNAFDAVEAQTEKWVRVEWFEDHDSAYVYVTDSGPGIPIKFRSRIFDPFFTTKGPNRGTGLGLSLAMSVAAHHYGSLTLDNLHAHTRFAIQLPKKQRVQKAA